MTKADRDDAHERGSGASDDRASGAHERDDELDFEWEQLDLDRIFKKNPASDSSRQREGRDKYKLLLEVSKGLAATLELDELLVRILDSVLSVTRMQNGFLMLRSNDGRFQVGVARNIDRENIRADDFQVSRSVVREVARTGRPIYIADIEKRLQQDEVEGDSAQRTIVCFPLLGNLGRSTDRLSGGRDQRRPTLPTIGLIYVESPLEAAEFPIVDLEYIEALAGHASVAIENARLYEEVSRDRLVLADENRDLRREVRSMYSSENIIGNSSRMRAIYDMIARVGRSNVNVMIRGESGTGKEMVAKTVHYNSDRAKHPFVSINCAALPETLLESELFGIEKGVATGVDKRIGKFEQADGGTFFLDEIGDMSPPIQAKLLRAIETHEIERVGGMRPIRVDVRILAATHRDLEAGIRDGSFREDLYFRLNVVPIFLPPLRERAEDVPELIEHFIHKHVGQKGIEGVTRPALDALVGHDWPGNVRELENVIQRAILMCDGNVIDIDDLPQEMFERRDLLLGQALSEDWTADRLVREYAVKVLARNKGNLTRTARALGMDFKTLKKRLEPR